MKRFVKAGECILFITLYRVIVYLENSISIGLKVLKANQMTVLMLKMHTIIRPIFFCA